MSSSCCRTAQGFWVIAGVYDPLRLLSFQASAGGHIRQLIGHIALSNTVSAYRQVGSLERQSRMEFILGILLLSCCFMISSLSGSSEALKQT